MYGCQDGTGDFGGVAGPYAYFLLLEDIEDIAVADFFVDFVYLLLALS